MPQTADEWLKQKKTQLKYLTQQVAALQVYEADLSKGYEIAKAGLHAVSDSKNKEFSLHNTFYSSLLHINPSIQHYARIEDIVALQVNIVGQCKTGYKNAGQSGQLSSQEMRYINSVFTSLLNGCANDISDLTSLITDRQLQLSDDERLQRIDVVYKDMLDKYGFVQSFTNQVNLLAINRQKEQNETASLQSLYHLK